jgi:hypothetical protein
MSHRIASLINQSERVIAKAIDELEAKNGYPSHDVRHLAQNIQRVRTKISDLGLDADDTTAPELYHALLIKFEKDAAFFDASFGFLHKTFAQRLGLATKIASSSFDMPSQWALKPKAAKSAIRANQPKRLMKFLHYRSLESMLKRENIYELFIGSQLLESNVWHKNLSKYISKLDQFDFEMRPLQLVVLDHNRWSGIDAGEYTIFDNHVGAAAIMPSQDLKAAPLLTLVLLQIEEIMPNLNLKPGSQLVKVSEMLKWWADMDHLVAELAGAHVSLNLKDCALNSWLKNDFESRITDNGRQSFWQELLSRYPNHPVAEAFDDAVRQRVANLKLKAPQPAFEFVEEDI